MPLIDRVASVAALFRRLGAGRGAGPRPLYRPGELPPEPVWAERAETALAELAFVVFDTETTGLRPSAGDEIVQLAGVRIAEGRIRAGEQFDELVDPGRPIPRAATRIHGIDDAQVRGRPAIEAVLRRFHDYVGDGVLVAHNAAFDMRFLELKQARAGCVFANPVLDTLLLSAVLCPAERDHGLDAIAERFGLTFRGRHNALGDALVTARAFLALVEIGRAQGMTTLADAIRLSRKARRFRRLQRRF